MSGLGHISATASLNIDPFQQSTRVLQAQTKALDRNLRAMEMNFKNSGKSIGGLKNVYDSTGKAVKAYTSLLAKQKEEYDEYAKKIGDIETASDKEVAALMKKEQAMMNTASKLDQLTAKMQEQENQMARMAREMAIQENSWVQSGKKMEQFGTVLENQGERFKSFGSAATKGLTVPIVAGVGVAIKAASDYESAFAGVRKTVDMTESEFDKLSTGIRNMSKEMPASATSIAEVAEAAGQLGIQNENILSFSETMINMGVATNLSADEAATALARFANIMGMNQSQFENLGSSIVELGNNFATTESEITQMGLRLAGVGKQIGLSEADVMGLAAAMSTVGIEAEAGGTAMTMALKKMQNAVSTYKDSSKILEEAQGKLDTKGLKKLKKELEDSDKVMQSFSKTAGVTSEEFAKLFTENPARALQKYVEGLEKASKNGENLNSILSDVNITGIREADAMLRLAGNSKLLGEALDMSSSAWQENTALSDEAAVRYETLESKMQMLKNQLTDVAIEFGGPFVDALKSGLDASMPFIESLSNMAKKFSEVSPETQKMIMKTLAFTAAIGPASSLLGSFLKITGGGIRTVGNMAKRFGMLQVETQMAKTGISAITSGTGPMVTAVEGATTGVAGFVKGLGLINPTTALVTAALVGGIAVWQLWGKEALESARRTREWGVDVTKEQDTVLKNTQNLQIEAKASMDEYQAGVSDAAEGVKQAYADMGKAIEDAAEKQAKANQKMVESLPEEMQKNAQNEIETQKKHTEQIIQETKSRVERAQEIMENAYSNNRQLTAQENAELVRLTEGLTKSQLDTLKIGAEDQQAILTKMTTNIAEMTPKQLEKYATTMEKAIDKQSKTYQKQVDALKEIYKDNPEMLQQEMEKLELRHTDMTDRMVADFTKAKLAAGTSYEDMAFYLGQWGYTVEEARALVEKFGDESLILGDKVATGTKEADNAWNSMILDPKTGEVRDNLDEFLIDVAQTDEGWNNLILAAKEAEISSNARETIAIAIGEAGRWNELSLDEKTAVANGDPAVVAMYDAIDSVGAWNEAAPVIKDLSARNAEAITKITQSKDLLQAWNDMSPDLKNILVNDQDKSKIMESTSLMNEWNHLPEQIKNMIIRADTSGAAQAQSALNSVNDKDVYIRVHYQGRDTGQTAIHHARGTNFHKGGPAVLGDGGRPEPFLTPQGHFGISPDKDTFFPNLPRGTKVWSSVEKFKREVPHFANGTDFSNTKIFNGLSRLANQQTVTTVTQTKGNDYSRDFETLIMLLKRLVDNTSTSSDSTQLDVTGILNDQLGTLFKKGVVR